jgi:hypothetical protein
MTDDRTPSQTDNAFCIGCGYSLRRLPANRCPECGREFDPSNPRTMNIGRPLRPWQRWLLKPIGWPTIAPAIVGTIGLMYLSGWPRLTIVPWSVLYGEFHWPRPMFRPITVPDVVFYISVLFWLVFVASIILWRLARLILVPRAARNCNVLGPDPRRRHQAMKIAVIVSACCLVFGWQQRIGRRWMARVPTSTPPSRPYYSDWAWRVPPVVLSQEHARQVLAAYVVELPSPKERMSTLKLLVESAGRAALPALVRGAEREQDPSLLIWELRLIGLSRDPSTANLLISHLQDARPAVRAAAADAIGILHQPSYSVSVPEGFWVVEPISLDSIPAVNVGGVVSKVSSPDRLSWNGGFEEHDLLDERAIAVDPSVRLTLQKLMTEGSTLEEREAAARALVAWPPDKFQLRVAEWGVWLSNNGQMALARSVIEEIPPFVHGTGNPTTDFTSYFLYPSMVTKPIVHLTTDTAVAVDMEVRIRDGRPWFAYPKPDDFGIGNESSQQGPKLIGMAGSRFTIGPNGPKKPDEFEAPTIPSLPDCREGYPWLLPHHRIYSSDATSFGGPAAIYDLGVRWQSLIVCPQRPPWMKPPLVPDDPKFHWWRRLRDVPSSWVCNRGEAERFVYYDGPTRAQLPVIATLGQSGRLLNFVSAPAETPEYNYRGEHYPTHRFQPMAPNLRDDLPLHEGLYIEVRSGIPSGQAVSVVPGEPVALMTDLPLHGDAVISRLRQMLTTYGLTAPEAEGLIDAWSPQFFHTEGRRLLLRMSPADYAKQCPMQVRPTPTEVVRLGLVLTEFDPKTGPSN